jgi:hypothetical protein
VRALIFLFLFLSGCIGGGTGLDLPFLEVVYECDVEDASAGYAVVNLELCFNRGADELESQLWDAYGGFAICNPTQRHLGPCQYCCGPNCGRGANARNGAWCP